jgi:RNA recognition motif-containing protein
MGTHIHLSGLSYFCTDERLRQAFIPFGTVVLARVLRDEWGHSLGLGIVHMACTEDVERVFNEHQRFEVSGSRVDLWEPAELEDFQGRRIVAYDLRDRRAAQRDQDKRQKKNQTSLKPLAVPKRRSLIEPSVPSSRTAKH